MAELIVKDALIREIKSVSFTEDAKKMKVGSDAEMDGFFKGYVEGMLYFIPTTTEAEIRASAIEEFAEKFIYKVHCEGCSGCTNCYETGTQDNCDTYRYFAEAAEELKAELLKEE